MVGHALSVGLSSGWIVDSGATSHMCIDKQLFMVYQSLKTFETVTLGDIRCLEAVGNGTVTLAMKLPGGENKRLGFRMYYPKFIIYLVYQKLLSMERLLTSAILVVNSENKLTASASKCGSLYFLKCQSGEQVNAAAATKEDVWHRWYGRLGAQGLRQLVVENLVDGFLL